MNGRSSTLFALLALVACGGAPAAAPSEPSPASSTSPTPATTASNASTPAPAESSAPAAASAASAPAPTAAAPADGIDRTGDVCAGAPSPSALDAKPSAKKAGVNLAVLDHSVQVNGRISPDDIKRVVKQNASRIQTCYDSANEPQLVGRLAVKLVIDDGDKVIVSKVEAKDAPFDATKAHVPTCVARALCDATFPKPTSGTTTAVIPFEATKTKK